jgi:hypothetical protein
LPNYLNRHLARFGWKFADCVIEEEDIANLWQALQQGFLDRS